MAQPSWRSDKRKTVERGYGGKRQRERVAFLNTNRLCKPLEEVDRHLADHQAWVKQGFDDGVFVLSGGQRPRTGGALIAIGDDVGKIQARVDRDPFVVSGVAAAQLVEVIPFTVDARLAWMKPS